MSFSDNNNKVLLWDMLTENGNFSGLNDVEQVKYLFDNTIADIEKQYSSDNIVNKNKRFLGIFIETLKNIRERTSPQTYNTNYQPNAVNREDIHQQRNNVFEQRLKTRQQEFTSMIQKPTPPDIDFTDKSNDNGNVDEMLRLMESRREKDLENISLSISNNQDQAKTWLNNGSTTNQPLPETNNPQLIKIDHKSSLPPNDINEKHVSFKEDNDLETSFFNKLKAVNPPSIKENNIDTSKIDSIMTELREIKEKQQRILDILDKKQNIQGLVE